MIMKKLSSFRSQLQSAFIGTALLAFASCTENPASPTDTGSTVVMRTELDNSVAHSASSQESSQGIGSVVDSLQVTSAAYVASNFMLRSDLSDSPDNSNLSEGFIRPEQFILVFDASGRQYIGEHILFSATYQSARFDIDQAQGRSDSLASALGPFYASVLGGNAVSPAASTIRVQGYLWSHGVRVPFTYATSVSGSGRVIMNKPLVVTPNSPMEVIVRFTTTAIFTNGSGMLLDPRDSRNTANIDANLKTSLIGDVQ